MVIISIYKKQREQIKSLIITTAIDLFRKKGYENVTVDEITKTIEIAKGTYYNYFKSKGELLLYWSAERFSQVDIQCAMDKDKSTEDNLRSMLEVFANIVSEDRGLFVNFIKEIGAVNVPLYESRKDFDFAALLAAVISNSHDGNKILSDNLGLKIQVLNSAIFSAIVGWTCSDRDIDGLGMHLTEIMKICLYGLVERKHGRGDKSINC